VRDISSDQVKHVNLRACAFAWALCKQVASDDLFDTRMNNVVHDDREENSRSRACDSPLGRNARVTGVTLLLQRREGEKDPRDPIVPHGSARAARYWRPPRTEVMRWVLKPSQCMRPT